MVYRISKMDFCVSDFKTRGVRHDVLFTNLSGRISRTISKETKCTEVKDLSKKCIWESGTLVLGL